MGISVSQCLLLLQCQKWFLIDNMTLLFYDNELQTLVMAFDTELSLETYVLVSLVNSRYILAKITLM